MSGFYSIINPIDSTGRTKRTVNETMYDLYNLGEDVKNREGPGLVINPWDVQSFALGITNERDWYARINKRKDEERQRMGLVNEAERAKKGAESMAMSGMSAEERGKYRKILKAKAAEEKLRLYLEGLSNEAAERKKIRGLMPKSIQVAKEEAPFGALDRMEDERLAQSRRGMLPGRGGY